MKNSKITRKITQGMYVLTVDSGGCVVDAVMRAGGSGENALVAVAVAKSNHTNALLQKADKFALSVLGEQTDPQIIDTFGFKSSRDIDKLADHKTLEVEGVKVLQDTLGYMVLEKIDAIENDTHTIFIGKMIEGTILDDAQPMTYDYYQEHKSDLTKVTTDKNQTAWVCTACGYVYYGEEVPDDFRCPLCGLGKEYFKKKA